MKKIKTSIQKYWNWRSKSYGFDMDKSIKTAESWESVLKNLVQDNPGKHAIDIGTGRGQFAVYLAQLGFSVTGIDLSENMIYQARENAKKSALSINFKTQDAENLQFNDNTFDVVVSRNLLWTLPDPGKAVKEWRRVLKPGGTIVISDGFWMNYTWKRLHHLVFNLMKNMFKNSSMISARFFLSYAPFQKHLPFYEGVYFKDVNLLLQKAQFKEIKKCDTSCFGTNPYFKKKRMNNIDPLFFIAHAKR